MKVQSFKRHQRDYLHYLKNHLLHSDRVQVPHKSQQRQQQQQQRRQKQQALAVAIMTLKTNERSLMMMIMVNNQQEVITAWVWVRQSSHQQRTYLHQSSKKYHL